jgi:2-polyprenyl-3-methyl-5-hydroxy-6-metoxy-1,4-benzoquinol methylase
MNCYLCDSTSFLTRKGKVRDNPKLQILECRGCGLVSLSEHSHITNNFYTNSGMHGEDPISIEAWLKDTKWDDERRFRMLKSILSNKKLLDFGCGAGGFLQMASSLVDVATGIELEKRVTKHWLGKLNIVQDIVDAGGVRLDYCISCY